MGRDFVKGKVNSSSFRITVPLDYEGPWKSDYATALVVLQNIQKRWRREGREKFSALPFAWSVMSRSNSTSAHYCRLGFVLSHVCIFANASQLSLSEVRLPALLFSRFRLSHPLSSFTTSASDRARRLLPCPECQKDTVRHCHAHHGHGDHQRPSAGLLLRV